MLRWQHRRLRAGTGNGEVRHALHLRAELAYNWRTRARAPSPNSSASSQSIPPSGQPTPMLGVQLERPSLYDLKDQMKELKTPTLILRGDEDWPCLLPGLLMKETIPSSALAVMPNCGHGINIEEPDRFNRIVGRFSGPRRFRPLADARPARYERLHPRHALITRNDKETSRGRSHSTRNRPTRARIRSELLIPRKGRGQPGAQMATTFAPRRQGPVEVRAWVHRRSSPRPSSFQIQVKS